MSFQKHCPGCFRRKDNHSVCPHCGYDEAVPRSPLFLPHGAVLAGQYRVGKVLGRPGGFGITYLGWDIYLQQKVAIKEYLPPDIAARIPESQDITVHTQDDRKGFESGKEQFLREARIVARLDHPNVVRVRGFFNANDTAYMVMDYYEGMSLDAYFVQMKPQVDPTVASSLTQMILDGLDYVHRHGVTHRDIKPHNIYLAAVGKPILLDFGAARQAVGSQKSISVVLTEGYAPIEQYQRHGDQGPWTDVYGAGATLYRMIVGKAPPIALDRLHRDTLESEGFASIPEPLKPILRKALANRAEERYQSAAAFKVALGIAMGPASAGNPMPIVNTGVSEMARETPSRTPLPSELLRDTGRSQKREPITTTPGPAPAPAPSSLGDLPGVVSTEPDSSERPTMAEVFGDPKPTAVAPPLPEGPIVLPDAPYKTQTPTAPRAAPRWLVPTVAVLCIGGLLAYLMRPIEPTRPVPAPASSAPATASAEPAASTPAATPALRPANAESFNLAKLPPLQTSAIPELSDIPAGSRKGQAFGGFRMSRTEITLGKFRTFAERAAYDNPAWKNYPCEGSSDASASWSDPGYAQTESHPVVCVNWDDARRYAAWLSQETHRKFRLPTDAEWEYAAAAGSDTKFWWGNTINEANASCVDCGRQNPSRPWIVATLGQNLWGLFGTASNVREWTCSAAAGYNCASPNEAGERVTRGGSWHDPSEALRTDFRASLDKTRRNTWTGFRVLEETGG